MVMVVGGWICFLGTAFVIVGLLALVSRLHAIWFSRRLAAAPRWACSPDARGRLPRYVMVTGVTAPGPRGPARSPGFDLDCVWYSSEVVRVGPDGDESRSVFRDRSDGLIGVADQTGRAVVDVGRLAASTSIGGELVTRCSDNTSTLPIPYRAGYGIERLQRAGRVPAGRRGILGYDLKLQEACLEPDRPITVLGRPRRLRDGSLLLQARGLAVSPETPDRWLALTREDAAAGGPLSRMIPIGLGIFAVGAAVVAVGVSLS